MKKGTVRIVPLLKMTSNDLYWLGLGCQVTGGALLLTALAVGLLGLEEESRVLLRAVLVPLAVRGLLFIPYVRAKRRERRNQSGGQ